MWELSCADRTRGVPAPTGLILRLSPNSHEASLDVIHQFEHSFQLLLRIIVGSSETFQ